MTENDDDDFTERLRYVSSLLNERLEKIIKLVKSFEDESFLKEYAEWISRVSHGTLDGNIDKSIKLLLTSIAYFHGEWKQQFDVNDTIESDFYDANNEKCAKRVMLMTIYDAPLEAYEFDISREEKIIRMIRVDIPLKQENFSLSFIVPKRKCDYRNVDQLIDIFDKIEPQHLISKSDNKRLQVTAMIPKMKIESTFDMNTSRSESSKNTSIFVEYFESIVHTHAAIIQTDENGVTCSANEDFEADDDCAMMDDENGYLIKLNCPFMFCVNNNNLISFIGYMFEP
ncbi:serpin B13-like protein [Leptotrombidium deliense]|uniref:Serpin B13-like protein n=1 Tax=Leptotrombidium deliense TaxID=299467 RepID=A0A443S1T7_9ACAR|nr:serpin B13-like protein [Leptotrombidium deliense]